MLINAQLPPCKSFSCTALTDALSHSACEDFAGVQVPVWLSMMAHMSRPCAMPCRHMHLLCDSLAWYSVGVLHQQQISWLAGQLHCRLRRSSGDPAVLPHSFHSQVQCSELLGGNQLLMTVTTR